MTQIHIVARNLNGGSMSHVIHRDAIHALVTGLLGLLAEDEQRQYFYDDVVDVESDEWPNLSNLLTLLQTIAGFHSASLDPRGRHKPRYVSTLLIWKAFLEQLELPTPFNLRAYASDQKHSVTTRFGPTWTLANTYDTFALSYSKRDMDLNSKLFPLDTLSEIAFSDIISKHPTPVFQRICLCNLPPELIHRIMEYLTATDARRFGYTCQVFRKISLQYIYDEEWLILDPRFAQEGLINDAGELDAPPETIKALTLEARRRFARRAEFICRNPDISKQLRSLRISGCWRIPLLDIDLVKDECRRQEYYQPVFENMIRVLSRAPKVHTLVMANFKIPLAVAEAITSLPCLTTLDFSGCQPTFDYISIQSASITNLVIQVDDALDIWNVLPGMANIRVLHVEGSPKALTSIPSTTSASTNPFKTIERLVFLNLCYEDVSKLCAWIQEARGNDPSRLTHVKLQLDEDKGFDVGQIHEIIQTLRGDSLEVLVLNGVDYGEAVLFQWFADAFPYLRSLTVHYLRTLDWPSLCWDYARTLSSLKHLKYFQWNQWPESYDYTNAVPSLFDGPSDAFQVSSPFDEEDEIYENARLTVKLFAAYSPQLTRVSYADCDHDYQIHRNPAGIVTLSKVDRRERPHSDLALYHNPYHGSHVWNL
ncbi:hypothetical protein QCA50_005561 [Cerrena zonata]|uniref:F-box domain-containing protein n=1 Tax=Cerrena zonata TaxID=2478898 RepID=A0AAW0GAK7_9APHY